MKVLFIRDLKGQGKKGEQKEVKTGYAQNFLIKNGYAVQLNDQTLSRYNQEQQEIKRNDEQNRKIALKQKESLEKVELSFRVQVGKDEKVFGRISTKQIKEKLDSLGYDIDKKQIIIKDGASSLGYHYVDINLYKDIFAKIRIKLEK
ncbi:MAG: 50S ribosomal protein L9 [Bacilli bacterium]